MPCSLPRSYQAIPFRLQDELKTMKLTRFQLVHATDKQLAAIGVTRRLNAGWLKKAVETEWTKEDLNNFADALVKKSRAVADFELKQQFHHVLASIKAGQFLSAQDAARKILEIVESL